MYLTRAVTLMLALALGPAYADSEQAQKTPCSNATLSGDYGLLISGVRPTTAGGPTEAMIGTLIRSFDGHGNFTQVNNVHGATSGWVADRPGSGTYSINPDCTGVVRLRLEGVPFQPEERIVVVDDGNGIFGATSQPAPRMVTQMARKISNERRDRDEESERMKQLLKQIAQRLGLAVPK